MQRTKEQQDEVRRLIRQFHRLVAAQTAGAALRSGTSTRRQEIDNDREAARIIRRLEGLNYDVERLFRITFSS